MCGGMGQGINTGSAGTPRPAGNAFNKPMAFSQQAAPFAAQPSQFAARPNPFIGGGMPGLLGNAPMSPTMPAPGMFNNILSGRKAEQPPITAQQQPFGPNAPTPNPPPPPPPNPPPPPPPNPAPPPPNTPFIPDPGPQPTGPGFSALTYQQYMDHFFNNPSHDTQVMNGMLGMHPVSEDEFNAIRGQQANFGPGR